MDSIHSKHKHLNVDSASEDWIRRLGHQYNCTMAEEKLSVPALDKIPTGDVWINIDFVNDFLP